MLGKDQAENFLLKKETNMKTNRLHKHLALAAVATAAVAATSNADVVYSGPVNIVVPANIDGTYMNVETGQYVNGPGSGAPGWDVNPYGTSTTAVSLFAATGTGYMRNPGAGTSTGRTNLAENTNIGSTSFFYGSSSATIGTLVGQWSANSSGIYGFKFRTAADGAGPATHYGWMRIAIGANAATRTIVDYAYESIEGASIAAGVGGGPPPAYDPCAAFNPVASVGNNNLPMNSTTATDLAIGSCGTAHKANYFKFVAPIDGSFGFNACLTTGVNMAILDGCAPGSSVLSCASGCQTALSLTAGQIVYCVIGGDSATTVLPSPINIVVSGPPLPACVEAAPAVFGDNVFDDTASTTPQVVQSNAAGTTTVTINKSVWYAFTAGATGAYSFRLCGSTGDTMIAIGAVCPTFGTTFQTIAYNDDAPLCSSGGTANLASIIDATNGGATGSFAGFPLTQDLVSGTTYYIVAGSYSATVSVTSNLVIDGPPQGLPCPGDYNGDGFRDGADLAALLSAWGTAGGDINGDGATDGADLSTLLSGWGTCPQ